MSTRVQKGSQKFKPLAKPRAGSKPGDACSRQTSSAPDSVQERDSTPRSTSALGQASFRIPSLPLQKQPQAQSNDGHSFDSTMGLSQFVNLGGMDHAQDERQPDGSDNTSALPVTWTTPWTHDDVTHINTASRSPTIINNSRATPIVISTEENLSESHSRPGAVGATADNHDTTQEPNGSDEAPHPPRLNSLPAVISSSRDSARAKRSPTAAPIQPGCSANAFIAQDQMGPIQDQSRPSIERGDESQASPTPRASGTIQPPKTQNNRFRSKSSSSRPSEASQDALGTPDESQSGASAMQQSNGSTVVGTPDSSAARSRKRRRRTSSGSKTVRQTKTPSLPPFDPNADPGEELDPTSVTMATICADTGHGRVSTKAHIIQQNHQAWKATNREKQMKIREAQERKKYGRTEVEDEPQKGGSDSTDAAAAAAAAADDPNDNERQPSEPSNPRSTVGDGFNYNETLTTNRYNVQIRIGPNGETIIDEESLLVDRAENPEYSTEQYTHIEESDQTKFINSMSYGKKSRGSRWSAEETELFYEALSQFGENYELISYVLPGRDRKACLNKFKAEDKKNPQRIDYCLSHRVPYDLETLQRMTGRDFSGPPPEIRVPERTRVESTVSEPPEDVQEPSTEVTAERPTKGKQQRKKSKTPAPAEDGLEIVGDIGDIEPFS